MNPTAEQRAVIQYTGHHLVVKAYAGCGKTSTLVAYAKHHSQLSILYLAYNRTVRDEGVEKFPNNVTCKTSHQLAWPQFGRHYQHKLGNLRLTDAATVLRSRNWATVREAVAVLNGFLSSADPVIDLSHVQAGLSEARLLSAEAAQVERLIQAAQVLWSAMTDPTHRLPCPHDAYLKLFQLSAPTLAYDVILFDEAQDSNPVTAALLAGQASRKVFVGDQWQQIYRWRGAENALDQALEQGAEVMYLTHSFRFGPMIAGVANAILRQLGETRPVAGCGARDRVLTSLPLNGGRHTVLNRTVAGVITTAIDAITAGLRVYWNGGIEAYQLADLEDVYCLKVGRKAEIRNKRLLGPFRDYEEFVEAAEASEDAEMKRMIRIVNAHGDIPKLIAALRRNSTDDAAEADLSVSTCHRAKGLEWDVVLLDEDFPDLFDDDSISPQQRADELNLLYVAATRARKVLVINSLTQKIILRSHAQAQQASIKGTHPGACAF